MISVVKVETRKQKRDFLRFPYSLYKDDPLWVPPVYADREKNTDPKRGDFFKNGYADFYLAMKDGEVAGTVCMHHEDGGDPQEATIGFFECVEDAAVAKALFDTATDWATAHSLTKLVGTYNMDREENRGVLIEGRDRPPALLCGHNPPYYQGFFEAYGFGKQHDDGLAYECALNLSDPKMQRLFRLAEKVRQRRAFTIRTARMEDVESEIGIILELQNRALAHLEGPAYTRASIEAMVLPLKDLADADLVLFVEDEGKAVGWFPAVPNFNEVLIHLNGLRTPWDYVKALMYKDRQPKCLAIKSVAVLPEYWDTGAAIMLFSEMVQRAAAKGYTWLDLSLTGEDNPDTWDLAHNIGAKIYKRYRFYLKVL